MKSSWNSTRGLAGHLLGLGFGLAAILVVSMTGCGGKSPETGEAVLVPEPNATIPTVGTSATAPAPTATTGTAPATTTTPTAMIKAEGWGTLKGQITLKGAVPAVKVLVAQGSAPKDPEVCAKSSPVVSERLVVDEASKGVKNVLIYLPKPTAVNEEAKSNATTAELVFDQEKCVFTPHVLAAMKGAKVELKNSDPVNHNINSRLKNNGFNKLLSAAQTATQPIDAAERQPNELTCDIHPWMKAYWMVLDNPYFAVTDAQGNYEIKNVPAGTQKVVVWQESYAPSGFVTASSGDNVDIKVNDTTTKDLTIDAAKLRPE